MKNTDDKCLYAALFLAYALENKEITINQITHKFDKDSYARQLSKYDSDKVVGNKVSEKGKKNLYFFTH